MSAENLRQSATLPGIFIGGIRSDLPPGKLAGVLADLFRNFQDVPKENIDVRIKSSDYAYAIVDLDNQTQTDKLLHALSDLESVQKVFDLSLITNNLNNFKVALKKSRSNSRHRGKSRCKRSQSRNKNPESIGSAAEDSSRHTSSSRPTSNSRNPSGSRHVSGAARPQAFSEYHNACIPDMSWAKPKRRARSKKRRRRKAEGSSGPAEAHSRNSLHGRADDLDYEDAATSYSGDAAASRSDSSEASHSVSSRSVQSQNVSAASSSGSEASQNLSSPLVDAEAISNKSLSNESQSLSSGYTDSSSSSARSQNSQGGFQSQPEFQIVLPTKPSDILDMAEKEIPNEQRVRCNNLWESRVDPSVKKLGSELQKSASDDAVSKKSKRPAFSDQLKKEKVDITTSTNKMGFLSHFLVIGEEIGRESRHVEFKEGANRQHLQDKVGKYVCGFLNSTEGGSLFFGVNDDGRVTGIECPREKEDDFRLLIDDAIKRMRPTVFTDVYTVKFIPIMKENGQLSDSLQVLSIDVKAVKNLQQLFVYKGDAYIRRDGSLQGPLKAEHVQEWIKQQSQMASPTALTAQLEEVTKQLELEKERNIDIHQKLATLENTVVQVQKTHSRNSKVCSVM